MLVLSTIVYTITFVFFTIFKDYIININFPHTSDEKKSYINKRWMIFYFVGLVILALMY